MPSETTQQLRRELEGRVKRFYRPPWWRRILQRFCGHNAEDFARAQVIERRIRRSDKRMRRILGEQKR